MVPPVALVIKLSLTTVTLVNVLVPSLVAVTVYVQCVTFGDRHPKESASVIQHSPLSQSLNYRFGITGVFKVVCTGVAISVTGHTLPVLAMLPAIASALLYLIGVRLRYTCLLGATLAHGVVPPVALVIKLSLTTVTLVNVLVPSLVAVTVYVQCVTFGDRHPKESASVIQHSPLSQSLNYRFGITGVFKVVCTGVAISVTGHTLPVLAMLPAIASALLYHIGVRLRYTCLLGATLAHGVVPPVALVIKLSLTTVTLVNVLVPSLVAVTVYVQCVTFGDRHPKESASVIQHSPLSQSLNYRFGITGVFKVVCTGVAISVTGHTLPVLAMLPAIASALLYHIGVRLRYTCHILGATLAHGVVPPVALVIKLSLTTVTLVNVLVPSLVAVTVYVQCVTFGDRHPKESASVIQHSPLSQSLNYRFGITGVFKVVCTGVAISVTGHTLPVLAMLPATASAFCT